MKKNFLFIGALLFCTVSFSQVQINLKDVGAHVGDSVMVCGNIFGGKYFADSKDAPTLLNMGAAYPNQQLTILIGPDARKEFKEAPETFYKDKMICVFGKVILYKEKPEIIIYKQEQMVEAMKGN